MESNPKATNGRLATGASIANGYGRKQATHQCCNVLQVLEAGENTKFALPTVIARKGQAERAA